LSRISEYFVSNVISDAGYIASINTQPRLYSDHRVNGKLIYVYFVPYMVGIVFLTDTTIMPLEYHFQDSIITEMLACMLYCKVGSFREYLVF